MLGVMLWSPDLDDLEIFRPEDINCHFASLPFEYQGQREAKILFIIVVSLAREADPPVHEQVLQTTDLEAVAATDPEGWICLCEARIYHTHYCFLFAITIIVSSPTDVL